jgi:iron complex outermembrane recepter protein
MGLPPLPSRPVSPILVVVALALAAFADRALAQTPDTLPSPGALKRLSLEQLMDIEVTSVSRRPEKLSATASAIQIITGDDIRRSGASSIPEALRLAPNLQVAHGEHAEFIPSSPSPRRIERGVYGKITWR